MLCKYYTDIISSNIRLYKLSKLIKLIFNPVGMYKGLKFPSVDIINCGAPRSGSTLMNIILKNILEKKIIKENVFCGNESEYINKLLNGDPNRLIKTHVYSYLIAKRIEKYKSIGFFTHRDIRDVIASQVQKGWIKDAESFIKTKKIKFYIYDAILYASTRNMHIITYDQLMNDIGGVINRVSGILNVKLTDDEISEIKSKISIKSINKRIKEDKLYDNGVKRYNVNSGLHENHIQNPESGKWKIIFNARESRIINDAAKQYLEYFEYR